MEFFEACDLEDALDVSTGKEFPKQLVGICHELVHMIYPHHISVFSLTFDGIEYYVEEYGEKPSKSMKEIRAAINDIAKDFGVDDFEREDIIVRPSVAAIKFFDKIFGIEDKIEKIWKIHKEELKQLMKKPRPRGVPETGVKISIEKFEETFREWKFLNQKLAIGSFAFSFRRLINLLAKIEGKLKAKEKKSKKPMMGSSGGEEPKNAATSEAEKPKKDVKGILQETLDAYAELMNHFDDFEGESRGKERLEQLRDKLYSTTDTVVNEMMGLLAKARNLKARKLMSVEELDELLMLADAATWRAAVMMDMMRPATQQPVRFRPSALVESRNFDRETLYQLFRWWHMDELLDVAAQMKAFDKPEAPPTPAPEEQSTQPSEEEESTQSAPVSEELVRDIGREMEEILAAMSGTTIGGGAKAETS